MYVLNIEKRMIAIVINIYNNIYKNLKKNKNIYKYKSEKVEGGG